MARTDKVVRRMLSTEEAAEYLGTTVRHLRRLASDHELSRYKVGGPIPLRRHRPGRVARQPARRGRAPASAASSKPLSVKDIH